MKRRIISLAAIFLLILQLTSPALATSSNIPEVKICSAYWDTDMLYTFVKLSDGDPEALEASLTVNNVKIREEQPQTMRGMDAAVHYMLLIDASDSMPKYRAKVAGLAKEILETEQNIRISVAQFGSDCSLIATGLTQWSEVSEALKEIQYNKDASNITGSVAQAMELLGKDGYGDGVEMTNLVVVTDGEPWYSRDPQDERALEEQANTYLRRMIAAYPEIVIHTFSFGQWDDQAREVLSDARGLHEVANEAEDFGWQLAEYAESVYCLPFELSGYENEQLITDEMILSVGRAFVSYGAVRNVNNAPTVEMPSLQTDAIEEDPADTTGESTEPPEDDTTEGPSGTNDETVPSGNDVTDPATEPSDPDTTDSSEPDETTESTNGQEIPWDEPIPGKFSVWYIVIPLICLVIFALAALLWKNRVPKGAVRMKIVQIAGGKISLRNVYYLDRELMIGSGKKCDIVIPGAGRKGVKARIFKQNQIIYVEDMEMSGEVLLNGMQIFSANRLRSDDEITVGRVILKVLF